MVFFTGQAMKQLLFIALGGSIGALARFGVARWVTVYVNSLFPWGTLVVNLSGLVLIGILYEVFEQSLIAPEWRNLLTIGFLGAYTTFSTYGLETLNLFRDGEIKLGIGYMIVSNIAGLGCVAAGIVVARLFFKLIK